MQNIQKDRDQFDDLQRTLLDAIVREIANAGIEAKIPKSRIEDFTDSLAFSIASILDGSRSLASQNRKATPVLTFQIEGEEAVIGAGESSWMHEYAAGAVEKLFLPDEDEGKGKWRLCIGIESLDLSSFGAWFIDLDLGQSDEKLLKQLKKEEKKFEKAGIPLRNIAKGWIRSPDKKSDALELEDLREKGVNAATLYRVFKDAQKRLTRH